MPDALYFVTRILGEFFESLLFSFKKGKGAPSPERALGLL